METGVLERIRGFEADIEKCIESIVQQELFSAEVTNERHRILLDHFKLEQLHIIRDLSEKLLDVYLDEDDIVEAQEAPSDGAEVIAAAVKQFEGRVADIREYHLNYRNLPAVRNQLATPDAKILDRLFSVNERYGACLDLEMHYNHYSAFMVGTTTTAAAVAAAIPTTATTSSSDEGAVVASAMEKRMGVWASAWPSRSEYFRFVPELPNIVVSSIDATRKLTGFTSYRLFVSSLLTYLTDFYSRIRPLSDGEVPRLLADAESSCEEFWAALAKEGGDVKVIAEAYGKDSDEDSEEEGEASGLARRRGRRLPHGTKASCGLTIPPALKRYIKSFSMWPLGLVQEFVDYRASVEEKIAQDTSAEDAKAKALLRQLAEELPKSVSEVKEVCVSEAKISSLLRSLLFDILQQTEKTMLRDYSKTTEELEFDRARADSEFAESLDAVRRNSTNSLEGTAMSYAVAQQSLTAQAGGAAFLNRGGPPRMPVPPAVMATDKKSGNATTAAGGDLADSLVNEKFIGEDGTAIPRWLVQLQQLEKAFVCEVCGGTVYQGPKVFREHFGQERHTEGLRRLGISQNLREFEGIASIRAAIDMRDRLGNVHGGFRKRLREDKELEEIQDGQGHVLTNRQYLSLQQRSRQV